MATTSKRTQQSEGDSPERGGAAGTAISATTTLAEAARQQMLITNQALAAMFRASEALHRALMQAGERAALVHGQAVENMRKASTAGELLGAQAALAVYQSQEAMRYWQEAAALTFNLGQEMMRPVPAEAQEVAPAAAGASMMDAAMSAAAPMADALQQMFTAQLRAASGQARHH